ncbi:IST1 homolog isoform X5 [Panulirus ornatus]|uniref:IST1 homolog isoform X5 n=1 Tax=Panulirus ornatus TaxID=150431 RepID=UPI003A895850
MFSSGPNYTKLKTNLRLAINRLKLLEKKKTELAQKARKEIADYLTTGKTERAKIRVEHIIREDYLVEAMEVTEMYCDLLLARYGLIQQMKDLDEGLAEAISSLIWAAPRLQTDVAELKIIADQLTLKYGKPYGQACHEQQVQTISERLIHKLSVQAPPKVLVEKYLVEIAKNYNIEYEPDPQVMREDEWGHDPLINLDEKNNLGGGGASGGGGGGGMNIPPTGFVGFPPQPMAPQPFAYPEPGSADGPVMNLPNVPGQPVYPVGGMGTYNIPPGGPPPPDPSADPLPEKISNNMQNVSGSGQWDELMGPDNSPPPEYSSFLPSGHTSNMGPVPNAPYPSIPIGGQPARPQFPPDVSSGAGNLKDGEQPKPAPRSKFGDGGAEFALPDLPNVPDLPGAANLPDPNETKEDIDFDDLTKRFEDLKKKK